MVIYGYLWLSMVIYGISMVIYGYLWFSMVIYGYLWISMDIVNGYLCATGGISNAQLWAFFHSDFQGAPSHHGGIQFSARRWFQFVDRPKIWDGDFYGDFDGFLKQWVTPTGPISSKSSSVSIWETHGFWMILVKTILRNTQALGMRSLSGSIGSLFLSHRSSQMEGWQVCQPGATWVIQCQCSCLSTPIRCMRWNIIILNIYIYIRF